VEHAHQHVIAISDLTTNSRPGSIAGERVQRPAATLNDPIASLHDPKGDVCVLPVRPREAGVESPDLLQDIPSVGHIGSRELGPFKADDYSLLIRGPPARGARHDNLALTAGHRVAHREIDQ
jgi:hypothetical protein